MDSELDGVKFLRENFHELFEMLLADWWLKEDDWPEKIDWKTFKDWFDVEFHSVLIDPTDQPISKEEW